MKTLLLFLIMVVVGTTASAYLFDSVADCDRTFRKPIKVEDNQRLYRSMGFMILVHT